MSLRAKAKKFKPKKNPSWLDRLKEKDPAIQNEIVGVIDDFIAGKLSHRSKSELYRWLCENTEFEFCAFSTFNQIMNERMSNGKS